MSVAPDPAAAVLLEQALRADRGRILSALIARVRDFQLAEDALQDAAASALVHWSKGDLPDRPEAWLIRVAFRKAIDRLRRLARDASQNQALTVLAQDEAAEEPEVIADERLRLIFTCCHPALEPKTRVALTLRTLCGLGTGDVARVFLDAEPAMAQRLSRAKAKIAAARIPFAVPGPEDLPERLNSVLTVVYLVFTSGYSAGPVSGRDLCEEAIYLARLINRLCRDEGEVEGCLALLLLTHARAPARIGPSGETVPPAEQDRSLWNQSMLDEGRALLEVSLQRGMAGPFRIKAAIAACHCATPTDWPQIAALYSVLLSLEDTPVIRLNHAVALTEAEGPAVGLQALVPLAETLSDFQPYHAVLADFLARTGQVEQARSAYGRAIALSTSTAERAFLQRRCAALPSHRAG